MSTCSVFDMMSGFLVGPWRGRQADDERGFGSVVVKCYLAFARAQCFARDGQAEAGAAGFQGKASIEQSRNVRVIEQGAVVAQRDEDRSSVTRATHVQVSLLGARTQPVDRIIDDVHECGLQVALVTVRDERVRALDANLDSCSGDNVVEEFKGAIDDFSDGEWSWASSFAPGYRVEFLEEADRKS